MNNKLTEILESKIHISLLQQFYENTELLQHTIFQKLFKLLEKLNVSGDIVNDIGRKYNDDANRKITDDVLEGELLNDYNEIINYLNNIPYIDNLDNIDETFLEQYNYYLEIINKPKNYEDYEDYEDYKDYEEHDFDCAILFFEELKENFRGRNQQAFDFYDKLQEKYYQILETNFGVKYDNVKDNWN